MKRILKFLHVLAATGLIGSLATIWVLVSKSHALQPAEFAAVQRGIAAVTNWVLLPSVVVAITSGLLEIAVHKPFMEARWVLAKAALGLTMLEGSLVTVQSTAHRGLALSEKFLVTGVDHKLVNDLMHSERSGLLIILALAIANVALAVWRPRLGSRTDAASE